MSHPSFPVNLNLIDRACLVTGEGAELLTRVRNLLEAGADVHVVSAHPEQAVLDLGASGRIRLFEREFSDADLEGKWLCLAVGASAERAVRIGDASERARVFFCAVDAPARNSFSHVALARAGSLVIAIATGGEAPALARRLREELQRLLDESDMAAFVERIAELRRQTPSADRKKILGEAVAALRFAGKLDVPK